MCAAWALRARTLENADTCLICVKIKLPGVGVMLFYLGKELGCISSVQGQTVAVAKGWWKQTWILSTVSISVSFVTLRP